MSIINNGLGFLFATREKASAKCVYALHAVQLIASAEGQCENDVATISRARESARVKVNREKL